MKTAIEDLFEESLLNSDWTKHEFWWHLSFFSARLQMTKTTTEKDWFEENLLYSDWTKHEFWWYLSVFLLNFRQRQQQKKIGLKKASFTLIGQNMNFDGTFQFFLLDFRWQRQQQKKIGLKKVSLTLIGQNMNSDGTFQFFPAKLQMTKTTTEKDWFEESLLYSDWTKREFWWYLSVFLLNFRQRQQQKKIGLKKAFFTLIGQNMNFDGTFQFFLLDFRWQRQQQKKIGLKKVSLTLIGQNMNSNDTFQFFC